MENLLKKHGIIKEGHFLLSSGRHSDKDILKDLIWQYPLLSSGITSSLAAKVHAKIGLDFDMVVGPALAGAVLAVGIAHLLTKPFAYSEKIQFDIMAFRRGFSLMINNKKVVVIEDVITTSSSVRAVTDAVWKCGGEVIAVVCMWNRNPELKELDFPGVAIIPILSLVAKKIESWDEKDCPLCVKGIPLTNPKNS